MKKEVKKEGEMKKWLIVAVGIFLMGCLVRTYTIEKPRVDLEVEGNRGYLMGTPQEKEKTKIKKRLGKKRKVSVFEIEFGDYPPQETESSFQEAEEKKVATARPAFSFKDEADYVESFEVGEEVSPKPRYEYYTIQENDTLQKISYKFYRTTRKWKMLYEENRDVLRGPNKIYPGVKIKIPVLD